MATRRTNGKRKRDDTEKGGVRRKDTVPAIQVLAEGEFFAPKLI
jgi:hypothetical protein